MKQSINQVETFCHQAVGIDDVKSRFTILHVDVLLCSWFHEPPRPRRIALSSRDSSPTQSISRSNKQLSERASRVNWYGMSSLT